jgi:SAM-dependent methyltransferase
MGQIQDRHWWFVARRRILEAIIRSLDIPGPRSILEVGCGMGGNLPMLKELGHVTGIEADDPARDWVAKHLGITVHAGHLPHGLRLPPGERFGLICLLDVLEHVEDDVGSLRTLGELLDAGGKLLVTVPAYQWLWSTHDESLHHVRRYTARRLRKIAEAAGLRVARISYFNTLLFPIAALARAASKATGREGLAGNELPAGWINSLFRRIFASEARMLKHVNLPFGVSIMTVLERPDGEGHDIVDAH